MAKIPASMLPEPPDPEVERLQALWHQRRKEWVAEGSPDSGATWQAFSFIETKLTDHLWRKRASVIEEDRKKHPRAKRNAPYQRNEASTRFLP